MGTRGHTVVIANGEEKVRQYGQWDHYPDGQGLTALRFLSDPMNVVKLKLNIGKVEPLTDQDYADAMSEIGLDPDAQTISFPDADKIKALHPEQSRDTGAGILALIAEGTTKVGKQLVPDEEALIWIEGQFVVDLDKNEFTTIGWSDDPVTFNFSDGLPTEEEYLSAFRD